MTTATKTETKTANNNNLENLTPEEIIARRSCEAKIRNGLKAYHKVGEALTVIAQDRLYRNTHSTMAKYAREVWDMTTARVSQYQHAFRVHQLFEIHGVKVMPKTESQCRPLARIPQDENADAKTLKAWDLAVTASAGKVTAKHVNDAVDSVLGVEPKQETASDSNGTGTGTSAGTSANDQSASAELRAELRDLRRKVAYLESALAAEKSAHARTQKAGGIPTSKIAQDLFKAGYRAMAKKCHPDHGGNADDMSELNSLKDLLINS